VDEVNQQGDIGMSDIARAALAIWVPPAVLQEAQPIPYDDSAGRGTGPCRSVLKHGNNIHRVPKRGPSQFLQRRFSSKPVDG